MSLVKSQDLTIPRAEPFRFVAVRSDPQASNGLTNETMGVSVENGAARPAAKVSDAHIKENQLLSRIAELEEALAKAEDEKEEIKTAAFDAGKQEGLKAADKVAEERLTVLKEAVAKEHKKLDETVYAEIDSGIEIARAIIQNVLGDEASLPHHVVRAAQRWKSKLADSSVLKLTVCAQDFEDLDQLTALEQAAGRIAIECDPDLDRGACIFDLQLGKLDASIPHQLDQAEQFLDGLTSREPDS